MESIKCPFVVLVDSREQRPYEFKGFRAGAAQQYRPLAVEWKWKGLKTGDYSIEGLEHRIAIERKSLADLYNSCGQGRERFEKEFARLAEFEYAAVVVEADWKTILKSPPEHTKMPPKSIYRTALSWSVRHKVCWWAMHDRRLAEITTFRLLEKFWQQAQEGKGD
ncbi:hypothetical protein LCGC14_0326240 [marine sediment metagenome]|uniref:ERCC4 domain-containing protein n=1 Tax=marine sediment metagenome TaxID=412755 RepID=A0A0F9WQ22_9ZZZZ